MKINKQATSYYLLSTIKRIRLRTWISLGVLTILIPVMAASIYGIFGALGGSSAAPSAHWSFDEGVDNTCPGGTNDACDVNGTYDDASNNGAVWQTEDKCVSGKCLYLNGTSSALTAASSADLVQSSSFTITAWVKIVTFQDDAPIIIKYNTGAFHNYYFDTDSDGTIFVGFYNGSTWVSSGLNTGQSLKANTWYHLAAVFNDNANTLATYINGNQNTQATNVTSNPYTTSPGIASIGQNGSYYMNGFIDELKVFSSALSVNQIKAEYAGGAAVFGAVDTDFITQGLVGYWPLDHTSGNATDASGNGSTLTNVSTTAYTAAKYGAGMEPDGVADYLYAADNAKLSITGSLTLAAWINPDDVSGTENIIAKWDGANESYRLTKEGANIRMYIDSDSNYQASTGSPVTANALQHVAGVYDSVNKTVKLFVNGAEVASSTTGTIPASIGDDAGRFHLGAEDSTTSAANFFDGHIDEARAYGRALTTAEVRALYNWAAGPSAYWDMNENTGQYVYDKSGNGVNLTLGSTTGTEAVDPVWEVGKYGSALGFDGTVNDRYARSASSTITNPQLSNFTITAWVRRIGDAEFNNPMYIFSNASGDSGQGVQLALAGEGSGCYASAGSTHVCFNFSDGTNTFRAGSGGTLLADSIWHHVAITIDRASGAKIYIDGIEQSVGTTGTLSSVGTINSTDVNCIGVRNGGTTCLANNQFNGNIDELKIYHYARTQQQIVEDMNAGHPTGGSPIGSQLGYWKLDEMNGTTAYNKIAANGNNLTLIASPVWAQGKVNGSLDFESSSSQYASAPDSYSLSLTSSLTLSAFIKPESTTAATSFPIASKGTDYMLSQYGDEIRMTVGGAGNYETTNAANLVTGTWYHVLGSYNAANQTISIYVNGIKMASTTTGTIPASISDGDSNFEVGRVLVGTVQTFQVATSSDDVFEISNTTLLSTQNQDGFGRYDAGGGSFNAGVRFTNVTIPQGTTINSASLQLYGDTANSLSPTSTTGRIYADAVNSAAAWSSSSRPSQITQTTANVAWTPSIWNGSWNSSPSIASIIQEIVNRPGWSSGNNLRLALLNDSNPNLQVIAFEDYTFSSSHAAKLSVTTGGTLSYYDGIIDEIKLYSSALTADQALVDYNVGSSVNFGVGTDEKSTTYGGPGGNPPILYLPLDENGGSAPKDKSGNNYTNSIYGGAVYGVGKFGSAVSFDNVNDAIQTNYNIDETAPYSVTMWVKPSSLSNDDIFFCQDSWTDPSVGGFRGSLYWYSNAIVWCNDNGCANQAQSTASPLTTGSWQHVAAVYDGAGTARIYVNGRDVTSDSSMGESASNLYIGASFGGCFQPPSTVFIFDGLQDEIKVFNYALSPIQVAFDYNRGAPMAWYKMDECTGTTLYNNAKNSNGDAAGNNATLSLGASGVTSAGTCSTSGAWANGATGKLNASLDFDGTDDVVTVANTSAIDLNEGLANGFTIGGWVYVGSDGENDVGQIFSKGTNTYCRTDSESSGKVDIECRLDLATDAAYNISSAIPINSWHHIAMSWENDADDEITIWIDGTPYTSVGLYSGDAAAESNSLLIGGASTANFDGQIDDFRVFNYPLSSQQIKMVMSGGSPRGSSARFGP